MTRSLAPVALACCLLLAGCSGLGLPLQSSDAAADGPPYPDPWPGSPTVVAINDTAADGRNLTGPVSNALDYWNEHDERYGTYTTEFVLRPDAQDPDIVVEFVPDIGVCGHTDEETTVGCAPVLSNQTLAERPTEVRIELGLSNDSTELIVEHELGHVLGLGHDDEPQEVMQSYFDHLNRPPMPNVSEREYTWNRADLTVYVDYDSLPGTRATIDDQIGHAIAYYESGAEGTVPANITLTRTDDRDAADIVITARPIDAGSDASLNGVSTDADPAIEYYTDQTIVLSTGLDPAVVGWHVGFWLGEGLVAPDRTADLPPPFDDPETEDRREWWR